MTNPRTLKREHLGTVVEVYRNLHRRCFSIRSVETGRVIGHATDGVGLVRAEFKVSEAGRQRVLRERRKNVHAVVRGTLSILPGEFKQYGLWTHWLGPSARRVSYDPYGGPYFSAPHEAYQGEPAAVHEAPRVYFTEIGVFV